MDCLYTIMVLLSFCFFFSSRRRHTRSLRDWSSDVCSSDLGLGETYRLGRKFARYVVAVDRDEAEGARIAAVADALDHPCFGQAEAAARDGHSQDDLAVARVLRSEERRVGKEGRSRWWAY